MATKCTVCAHADIETINEALIAGVPSMRDMAGRYGLTRASLSRHKNAHLPKHMAKAQEVREIAQADSLLDQMRDLQKKTLAILDKSMGKDERLALTAIREARSNIELIGRIIGELDESPKVAVLVNNPEWVTVRTAIMQALEPYPEARQAVTNGLKRLSG